MPNLLAHLGAQGIVTQVAVRKADTVWVVTGCLLPDLPWILQRITRFAAPGLNPYDVRLYAIVQATLAFSLIAALSISALSRAPHRTFLILAVGALLHLLLDAAETKWANGVHLLAPISWELLNLGLFWPDSLIRHGLTALGLGYVLWIALRRRQTLEHSVRPLTFALARVGLAATLLTVYLAAPLTLLRYPEIADNHYVGTLREKGARTGRYVEFDRDPLVNRDGRSFLETFAGEKLMLKGSPVEDANRVSLRARFVDAKSVTVIEAHRHSAWGRELPSVLGLLVLAGVWVRVLRPRT